MDANQLRDDLIALGWKSSKIGDGKYVMSIREDGDGWPDTLYNIGIGLSENGVFITQSDDTGEIWETEDDAAIHPWQEPWLSALPVIQRHMPTALRDAGAEGE